jgi:hypothetical protein
MSASRAGVGQAGREKYWALHSAARPLLEIEKVPVIHALTKTSISAVLNVTGQPKPRKSGLDSKSSFTACHKSQTHEN